MATNNAIETKKTSYIVRKRGEHEGRPLSGKTIKEFCGIRIQSHIKKKIIEKYDSIQKWIDKKVKEYE